MNKELQRHDISDKGWKKIKPKTIREKGAPVRKIQNTPFMNCRVFFAFPPRVPFSPVVFGFIFFQALSPIVVSV